LIHRGNHIIAKESYYLILIRYIEANAFRAKLVKKAEDWTYPYITLYEEWVKYVNTPLREGELDNIRNSVNRQAPLGREQW